MVEVLLIICVVILLFLGLLGSVVPVLPGPILSYFAFLISHFFIKSTANIDGYFVFWLGLVIVIITISDYFLQLYGVKKVGGGKYAIRGSLVGMLFGIFLFPPIGVLVGAFIGAYIGAKIEMNHKPVKIAFGALLGFISGTILKFCISLYIIYVLLF